MKDSSVWSCILVLCSQGIVSAWSQFAWQPSTPSTSSRRRWQCRWMHHSVTGIEAFDQNDEHTQTESCDRRSFFRLAVGSTVASSLLLSTTGSSSASARGLVAFPCKAPLLNVYHIMRAGTSLLEEEDIWSTNPLFLTNREAALSEKGVREVQSACRILQAADINPSVIKYSLAASSVDTAMVIRDELKVGQNRLIPEFTFMDPRAIGRWDMMSVAETYPAIVAMDELEAGTDGKGARPPPNTDGTPQDTLADQAIRLRQLMSVLETQFSGDNIVLVFPDGSSPALLSAMMAGIPYSKAHVLDFAPGEIRLNVTMQPTLALYKEKQQQNADSYNALIESGKEELERLRSMADEDLISKKDLLIKKERLAIEEDYRRKEEGRMAKEEAERQARLARQREIDVARMKSRGLSVDVTDNDPSSLDGASIPPLVIGGAFGAYAVVALSQAGQGESKYKKNSTETESTEASSPTLFSNATATTTTPAQQNGGDVFADMLQDYGTSMAQPGGSSLYQKPFKTEEDRIEEARQAMEDYMNQDDGGDAWLQIMGDLINEDDDDEDCFGSTEDAGMNSGRINGASEKRQ